MHRARLGEDDGSALPPYVPRDVDDQVRAALAAAAETGGFVLLTGDSTAGKTRTAIEALRAVLPGCLLLAPPSGADLRPLLRAPGEPGYERHVLWLDDLEHHLGPGRLEPSLLTSLTAAGLVVLATLRDERYDTLRDMADGVAGEIGPSRLAAESGLRVLNMVEPIVVRRLWSDSELARVAEVDDSRLTEAYARHGTHGIAEYLAAGPELLAEWRRAQRATTRGGHPRGAALVAAAVDLTHIGLIGDVPEALLREVHEGYLRALGGPALRPESYADAVAWASRIRYGVAGLLMEGEREGTKRPFDYLVDSVARDPGVPDPPDSMWHAALEYADDLTRPLIARTAMSSRRWAIAERALRPLAESGDAEAVINYTSAQLFQRGDPHEVEPLLRPLAEAGNPVAQLNLAGALRMRNEDAEAERWWLSAAEGGLSLASYSLFAFYRSKGEDQEAERWLRRAAEDGYVKAMTTLATLLHQRDDEAEAEPWWRRAALAGDTEAMYVHGHLLRLRGDDEAEAWLRRAAERGHVRAAAILGRATDERGDLTEAEKWWRVAAEAGNPESANELGVLLSRRGDRAEGADWYAKAAEGGHLIAMFNLAQWLAYQGDAEGAKDWHRRAGEAGHVPSLNNLGVLLRHEGDVAGAETFLRRAADAGDVLGLLNLVDLLISEERPEKAQPLLLDRIGDPDVGEKTVEFAVRLMRADRPDVAGTLLRWAAEAGRPDATYNLGLLSHLQGRPEEAERWWRLAAPEIPSAAYNVGSLLAERGETEEAASWWSLAADAGHQKATLRLAEQLIDSGRGAAAEAPLRRLAEELPEAAFLLGVLLSDRGGHVEAAHWWRRAEELEDADAALDCAAYFAERGDETRTELWCRKSAEAGHPTAALNLGVLLARRGALADAESWLAEAERRGVDAAPKFLAQVRQLQAEA
ncbi:tetratricopeptide repeat protein [Streptomyces sp. FZ201]|uniref:SEL1-like repeat protein n=1 Tax=Streptomyces sp. FZ201 TaxID=3057122 RepID=UPI0021C05F51|nr:tetratricopeptide repeat protein [Streptomyces sp. FZ201]